MSEDLGRLATLTNVELEDLAAMHCLRCRLALLEGLGHPKVQYIQNSLGAWCGPVEESTLIALVS